MRVRRRGFTLVEVVVVLGILALAAAVSVPAFRRYFEQDDMARARQRVEALFRLARDSAIHSGVPVTVVIDSVSGRVWLDSPPPESLDDTLYEAASDAYGTMGAGTRMHVGGVAREEAVDEGESIGLPGSVVLRITRARARFTFTPGGSAFTDSLFLRGRSDSLLVTVDPWTADAVFH